MNFENYFSLWSDLNTAQKKLISDNLITQVVKKGTIIHNGNLDCTGLLLVKSGQLLSLIHILLDCNLGIRTLFKLLLIFHPGDIHTHVPLPHNRSYHFRQTTHSTV